jgi:phenylpropionate dioxygenase-like ring-hydroxylating dioxygenase large terminal subunit
MLSREDNELLTRTGKGTPMGELIRRYWLPVLFTHQLPQRDGPPVRVKLMGEKLVAFRDTENRIGLLAEACPHRTASLFFGRNEECGLRCVYHGWKFDVEGNCVDMPSEPEGSNFKTKVKATAYPCIERAGLIWTYMGPAALKPAFPDLEWTQVPASHRFASRHVQECNWLQALEGGFDTSHLSFLHIGTAHQAGLPQRYEVLPMEFGFVSGSARLREGGATFWTANVMMMPFHKFISTSPVGAHMWVPIDDENVMNYSIDYWPDRPLTKEEVAELERWDHIHTENIPGTELPLRNRSNDYLIDRALQRSGKSFTGISGLAIQDCGIQESMGPIADRTQEHLGISDTVIIQMRKLLLKTVREFQNGATPPGLGAMSYPVRSGRFQLPPGKSFAEGMHEFLRIQPKAAAE